MSVLKALGLSGGQVTGRTLLERLGGMEGREVAETVEGLMMLDFVLCDMESIRGLDDLKEAKLSVNTAMLRDLREALAPQKKEVRPTRQRRG